MTNDALSTISRFVALRYPTANVAILAGSRSRGEESSGSDYDVVLLFESLPSGAWREMTMFEGQYIEMFAHDLGTLAYFSRAVDQPSGIPALPAMVADGVVVMSRSLANLAAARELAAETLRSGPPPLDMNSMRSRRFAITDLASALQPDRDKHVLLAAAAALYTALADFALRAAKQWSASGKSLPRALTAMDPTLATQFEAAFTALFAAGDVGYVQDLVDAVLMPYGGRLREGFQQSAPAEWRDQIVPGPIAH
jgi:hypothetical protein